MSALSMVLGGMGINNAFGKGFGDTMTMSVGGIRGSDLGWILGVSAWWYGGIDGGVLRSAWAAWRVLQR